MVRYHWLNGREFGQILGDSGGWGARHATVHGVTKLDVNLTAERNNNSVLKYENVNPADQSTDHREEFPLSAKKIIDMK